MAPENISNVGAAPAGCGADEGSYCYRATCIIGLGAIGITVATALGKSSADELWLVGRPNQLAAIDDVGLLRTGILDPVWCGPERFNAAASIAVIPRGLQFRSIFVCTKTYAVEGVAAELERRPDLFALDTAVFAFQNGFGSHEPLLPLAPPDRLYHARVITGAERKAPNHANVRVHGGPVLIGSLAEQASIEPAEDVARTLTAGGFPALPSSNILQALMTKLTYNTAVNALGAIHRCDTGRLVDGWADEVEGLARESFAVIEAAGYPTGATNVDSYMRTFHEEMIPRTRDHKSSMLQDLERGNRTEIDYFNGFIVRTAQELGRTAPHNEAVVQQIQRLETQVRSAKSPERETSSSGRKRHKSKRTAQRQRENDVHGRSCDEPASRRFGHWKRERSRTRDGDDRACAANIAAEISDRKPGPSESS